MKTLKRYWFMGLTFFKINVRAGLEYPAYLIGWLISNPLQFIFGLITIKVVISQFQPLGGWEFGQVVFLYGLGVMSHGLSVVFFIQTWYMDYSVTQGDFDRMLVRPLNVFFQFCFDYFNFIGITDLIPGTIIFIYGCVSSGFSITFINLLKLLLVISGATVLRGGIYLITGSLSFWIQRTHQIIDVHLRLFDYTMRYPMNIYPQIIQSIFTFVLPIGFICFYPAGELLSIDTGFTLPGSFCVWTFAVGIGVFILGNILFNMGLSRYESAGS